MERTVRYLFRKFFSGYNYPFIGADMKLQKMDSEKRAAYYRRVNETMFDDSGEMKGFMVMELENLKAHFYKKLATEIVPGSVEASGYRVTLIFIKQLEDRFTYLAKTALKQKYEKN